MTQDFTDDMRAKLIAYLATHDLPSGLGNEESACTLAAIRLAYDGQLNDDVIECMSPVLGKAAVRLQDATPDEMHNSARMDWLWTVVLPKVQPIADKRGFGAVWRQMCETKTADADAVAAAWAAVAARRTFWEEVDPVGVLERMTYLEKKE